MQKLKGENALVTDGSRGIGRAIALELARNGVNVAIAYHGNTAKAGQTVQEIQQSGVKGLAIKADLAEVRSIDKIYVQAERQLGKLDIVVSNAGIVINKPLADYTVEDYERTFNTNTWAPFFLMQHAAQWLNDGGRIIAISSGGTKMLLSGTTLYLGSKGAVEQFVRGISQEVGNHQITANVVSPGFTDTGLLTKHFRATAAQMSPFKRLGQPVEIARVVAFLASPEAGWVTGQNIDVGGGVM